MFLKRKKIHEEEIKLPSFRKSMVFVRFRIRDRRSILKKEKNF